MAVSDERIAQPNRRENDPKIIARAFSWTKSQTSIVHLIRHSINFVSGKDGKATAADEATLELEAFKRKCAVKHPLTSQIWRHSLAPSVE